MRVFTLGKSTDVDMNPEYSSERPRDGWAERTEADAHSPYKDHRPRRTSRVHLRLITGHETYRPRRAPDRLPVAASQKILDPYTLNHVVPFNYFCEWYKTTNARTLPKNAEIGKDELQESFLKYREDLIARTVKGFVKEHMSEEWFKEKYDPVLAGVTRGKLVKFRRWLYERFMEDLEAGKLDELTLDGAAGITLH
jgi:serrate RNA effector molecule